MFRSTLLEKTRLSIPRKPLMRVPLVRLASPKHLALSLIIGAFALSACGREDTAIGPKSPPEISLDIVAGGAQSGTVGQELPSALQVKVVDKSLGIPVPGYLINWVITSGGGSVFVSSTETDYRGLAQNYWTLGPITGTQTLEVRAVSPVNGAKEVFATFSATATLPQCNVAVSAGTGGTATFVVGATSGDCGRTATIQAVPSPGYGFQGWSDGSTRDPYTLTVSSNMTLTANFVAYPASSWRVQTEAPSGNAFISIWGSGTGHVYASGPNAGSMTLFDGTTWSAIPSSVPNGTQGIFGLSDNNVYAAGGNFAGLAYVLHYDGTQWSQMAGVPQDQFITGVWASSPNNVYATRIDGSVLHYDGSSWTATPVLPGIRLEYIFGTSATDIYAVGHVYPAGTNYITHFNGTSWSTTVSTNLNLGKPWASSPADVWVPASGGVILHYDGSSWSQVATPATNDLLAVWGTSPTELIAVGDGGAAVHFDGYAWTALQTNTTVRLTGIWGGAPGNYYASGFTPGTILHYSP